MTTITAEATHLAIATQRAATAHAHPVPTTRTVRVPPVLTTLIALVRLAQIVHIAPVPRDQGAQRLAMSLREIAVHTIGTEGQTPFPEAALRLASTACPGAALLVFRGHPALVHQRLTVFLVVALPAFHGHLVSAHLPCTELLARVHRQCIGTPAGTTCRAYRISMRPRIPHTRLLILRSLLPSWHLLRACALRLPSRRQRIEGVCHPTRSTLRSNLLLVQSRTSPGLRVQNRTARSSAQRMLTVHCRPHRQSLIPQLNLLL